MALFTFYQIFTVINHDTLELLHTTQIGGATLQKGDRITRGELVGGIDFFRYIGNEIEADVIGQQTNETYVIKNVYV